MEEGNDANELSVQGAIDTLEKALAYDAPLRTRGEGLSWLVWGLAFCLVALVTSGRVDWPLWVSYAVVIPLWATVALVGTSAVWRLAGIARPALSPSPVKVVIGVAGVAGGLFVLNWMGFAVLNATGSAAILALVIPSVPWGLLGWVQWSRLSDAGRRATVVLGVLMALLYLTYAEFVVTGESLFDTVGRLVMTGIMGGIPIVVGLAWTFRR